jgi:hypothetical protein
LGIGQFLAPNPPKNFFGGFSAGPNSAAAAAKFGG